MTDEMNKHFQLVRKYNKCVELRENLSKSQMKLDNEIAELDRFISDYETEIHKHEADVIIPFIESIKDPICVTAMQLRYMFGLGWKEVAANMGKPYNLDSVKTICLRYLKKVDSNE